MRILSPEDIRSNEREMIDQIKRGSVFIYPTDTIYGIGCNALNSRSVKKIRELKDRPANPFSIIAPSVSWIRENCSLSSEAQVWLGKLPGPYTLIFKLKRNDIISNEVNPNLETIGVRIPNHWISKLVEKANVPFVTTSVNRAGEDFMSSLEDLDDSMRHGIDFILYEGKKEGRPSKIVDLTENAAIIDR